MGIGISLRTGRSYDTGNHRGWEDPKTDPIADTIDPIAVTTSHSTIVQVGMRGSSVFKI